ncbi:MAG: hypothetical protein JWO40_681 [Candidatus Doudnabacteria bacterium]|nr:hypothetical protein [Candidatus Doudnabacteria bacterium]
MSEIPHLDRAIGLPSSESHAQEEYESHIREIYETRGVNPYENFELPKTERDKEIIDFVQQSLDQYLAIYNREKIVSVPVSKIHIFSENGVKDFTNGNVEKGSAAIKFGSMLVERPASDIQFALNVFHEMVHLKSYSAVQIVNQPEGLEIINYRSGFSVTSREGKNLYFQDLEEGVIGFLVRRFYQEHVQNNTIFSEKRAMYNYSRDEEYGKLEALIQDLWEKNQDKFENIKSIWDIFINTQLNGNLLPIGRLIESTYGKGSFRKLGENNL